MDTTSTIEQAGRKTQTVMIVYKGERREVEPYSFRQGPNGVLFFAYPLRDAKGHESIHSFSMSKIEQAEVTGNKFNPRWTVEF